MVDGAPSSRVAGRQQTFAIGPAGLSPDRIRRLRDTARTMVETGVPARPPALIGREAELAAIRWQLRRPDLRLLTLTGPPGVGKTSLALAAAGISGADFAGGVAYLDLSGPEVPRPVLPALASALGVTRVAGRPDLPALIAAVRERPRLIVLDGCERATGWTMALGELVAACPELRVLATGRSALGVAWEQEQSVLPLAVPDAGAAVDPHLLLRSPAVALFVDRVRAVRPEFAVTRDNGGMIAEICTRLDGLPLALDMAAAWARVLSVGAILARLDRPLTLLHYPAPDRPHRHQSLRAAIAWSDDLLGPAERRFFYRLAVCAGSFSFATAEAVANPREELGCSTFDLLLTLVEHNLLQSRVSADGVSHFRFFETIRAYGWERLAADPHELETALRRWGARREAAIERHPPRGGLRGFPIPHPSGDHPTTSAPATDLTAREREIAALVGSGLTSRQIAERLVISKRTVDTHADHIRAKLGLRSRAQVATWAVARGLAARGDAGPPPP